MKKFKYSISHRVKGKKQYINFKNKDKLINHLESNKVKMSALQAVNINFNQVSLPLNSTVWNNVT